jgi:hypothetical protein
VYSAEPFINPLVKLSDVTNNPKLAIEAMLRAIYPDQKIKVGIRKEKKRGLADTPYGKGSDSQASVNIEFMGEYSRADRPKLFPPKPEFAYLALTAGAVGNRSPLLEEVRIPLILVREVGSSVCNNNAKYSIIEGYALDWLLSQRPATLVQPTFAIECVRKAQSRGLAVYLFGGVRAVHTPGDPTEYSVHWNFMYQTPEGGCILLEVEDLSIQMDAMYGLSKDPQMDVIMATAYRALSPWVTEDVGMRLRPLENMPKPSPVTPRPPNPTEQKKEKRPTYQKAMDEIFRAFGQLGWKQSNPNLAVRHVTYGNYRVYLKAQSLYYEKGGPPWRLGDAHSLHIGDVRDITDYVRFVDSISERIEGF